jgi:hypothetical protein
MHVSGQEITDMMALMRSKYVQTGPVSSLSCALNSRKMKKAADCAAAFQSCFLS